MGQVTGAGDTPVRWPTHSLLPHPGIVGVDQERGPEKVEEGEEEDPALMSGKRLTRPMTYHISARSFFF